MQQNLRTVVVAAGWMTASEINDHPDDTRAVIQRCVAQMPSHADFIQAHCAAAKELETC